MNEGVVGRARRRRCAINKGGRGGSTRLSSLSLVRFGAKRVRAAYISLLCGAGTNGAFAAGRMEFFVSLSMYFVMCAGAYVQLEREGKTTRCCWETIQPEARARPAGVAPASSDKARSFVFGVL